MTSPMTDTRARATARQADEPVWREPGQIVSADYLKQGALRYSAADGEIIGRDLALFNNRPLYCAASVDAVVLTGTATRLRQRWPV